MDIPNTFNPNTTAESAKVNQNFTNVKTAVDTIEAFTFRQYIKIPGSRQSNLTSYGISTSFVVPDSGSNAGVFKFDKSKFGSIQAIYFACTLGVTGGTGYVQLYNYTDSVQETELSTTSTSNFNIETSADIKATIPNSDKIYLCRIKISSTSYNCNAGGAYLIVDYKIS